MVLAGRAFASQVNVMAGTSCLFGRVGVYPTPATSPRSFHFLSRRWMEKRLTKNVHNWVFFFSRTKRLIAVPLLALSWRFSRNGGDPWWGFLLAW